MAVPVDRRVRKSLRIIVADDHEWIRAILTDVVHQTLPTAEVLVTADGLEALVAFQTGECDFLVSNHRMPHMNGPSLMRHVREESPTLPIVAISTNLHERSEAILAGANWFLMKEEIMEFLPNLLLIYAGHGVIAEGRLWSVHEVALATAA